MKLNSERICHRIQVAICLFERFVEYIVFEYKNKVISIMKIYTYVYIYCKILELLLYNFLKNETNIIIKDILYGIESICNQFYSISYFIID